MKLDEPVPLSEWQQLVAERNALKAALREQVINWKHNECSLCHTCWVPEVGEPEHHATGCLAAPKDAP